jgi:eukaryotic-like serine/threonine-protein kinase
VRVTDWSRNGWFILTETHPDGRGDIVVTRDTPDADVRLYLRSPFNDTHGVVSPGGRWLAYVSDESGQAEVYVDHFPLARARARLTLGGGTEPRWSRDGTRVYFRRGSEVHAVTVTPSGETLAATASERLFDAGADVRAFDVRGDGQRVLVNVAAAGGAPAPLSVLVNLRTLLPSAP